MCALPGCCKSSCFLPAFDLECECPPYVCCLVAVSLLAFDLERECLPYVLCVCHILHIECFQ